MEAHMVAAMSKNGQSEMCVYQMHLLQCDVFSFILFLTKHTLIRTIKYIECGLPMNYILCFKHQQRRKNDLNERCIINTFLCNSQIVETLTAGSITILYNRSRTYIYSLIENLTKSLAIGSSSVHCTFLSVLLHTEGCTCALLLKS